MDHWRVWVTQRNGTCLLAAVINGNDVLLVCDAARNFFSQSQGAALNFSRVSEVRDLPHQFLGKLQARKLLKEVRAGISLNPWQTLPAPC